MSYTDAELEQMLGETESDLVERKESLSGDAPATAREAICAFANDLPDHRRAGVVFIGARNDGTPVGLPITDGLLLQLANMKSDGNIVPPPSISVERRTLRGAEIAVITVLPADAPPVSYRGRIWVRVGPRRGIATLQDERILSEKRRFRDRTFDAHPVATATLSDLSRTRFEEEYLRTKNRREIAGAQRGGG
jgi:ATP-dependent DNA helicase RecG